uniref:Avena alpha amylase trypsin inhibitor n=1 Tax=Avena insularis TaxID=283872 RepID=A0A1B2LQE9_9POAL|nr:avena alpha amylase trypsin inhibitor [Avena insularis]
MASKCNCSLFLLAAVLLSIFAAPAASAADNPCFPKTAILSSMLQRCRDYVEQQTCGVEPSGPFIISVREPYMVKERCCWEIANIPQKCRCEALRYLMRKTPASLPYEVSLRGMPGCPREAQMNFVRILVTPGQCNLATIYNVRYCPALDKFQY